MSGRFDAQFYFGVGMTTKTLLHRPRCLGWKALDEGQQSDGCRSLSAASCGHTIIAIAGTEFTLPSLSPDGLDMERYVADVERTLIVSALRQCNGVQTRAAETLKLSYRSFRHLLKKYDL